MIVKPDIGVGASDTFKLENDEHLEKFFETLPPEPYVMEEFITGDICSYDAGRSTAKAFGVKSRFVHLEFFRLTEAKKGLGEVGDFVGLEVNMRPAGGYTPDMIDFAHSTDVYQIWADMITEDKRKLADNGEHFYCVYASRRDMHNYVHSHEDILTRYGKHLVMCERMPEMMVPQMGNQMYTAKVADLAATKKFIRFVQAR